MVLNMQSIELKIGEGHPTADTRYLLYVFVHEHLRKIFHFSSGTQLRSRGLIIKEDSQYSNSNQHRSNLAEHITKLLKRLKHVWTPVLLVCHSKIKTNSIIM